MKIKVGGVEHYFFDPTPREIDAVVRGSGASGNVAVEELYPGQCANLFWINGWRPASLCDVESGRDILVGPLPSAVGGAVLVMWSQKMSTRGQIG